MTEEQDRHEGPTRQIVGYGAPVDGYVERGTPDQMAKLYAALGEAQAEFAEVKRSKRVTVPTREGGGYSFNYAPIEVLVAATRGALAKHGLVVMTPITRTSGKESANIVVVVAHSEGGRIIASFAFDPPTDIKLTGGHITYLRRYCYSAVLNLSADEDEDERVENARQRGASTPRPQSQATTPSRSHLDVPSQSPPRHTQATSPVSSSQAVPNQSDQPARAEPSLTLPSQRDDSDQPKSVADAVEEVDDSPPVLDPARWRAAYFAVVSGSSLDSDEQRAGFVSWHTGGKVGSLAKFLETATERQAEALVEAARKRVAAERGASQPQNDQIAAPKTNDNGDGDMASLISDYSSLWAQRTKLVRAKKLPSMAPVGDLSKVPAADLEMLISDLRKEVRAAELT